MYCSGMQYAYDIHLKYFEQLQMYLVFNIWRKVLF